MKLVFEVFLIFIVFSIVFTQKIDEVNIENKVKNEANEKINFNNENVSRFVQKGKKIHKSKEKILPKFFPLFVEGWGNKDINEKKVESGVLSSQLVKLEQYRQNEMKKTFGLLGLKRYRRRRGISFYTEEN